MRRQDHKLRTWNALKVFVRMAKKAQIMKKMVVALVRRAAARWGRVQLEVRE